MKDDFFDNLAKWLRELHLPEPELSFTADLTTQPITLDLAYPEDRVGLVLEHSPSRHVQDTGWHIWFCSSLQDARRALVAMAKQMEIEVQETPLNLNIVEELLAEGLIEQAYEVLQEIRGNIKPDHPDWPRCEELGAKLVRLRKKQRGPRTPAVAPEKSFENELISDFTRIHSTLPPHSYFGFFSPSTTNQPGIVDAIWAAKFDGADEPAWVATAQGHLAAETSSIEAVDSDSMLLDKLLRYLGSTTTFVWDVSEILPILQAWHYRVKGVSLPSKLTIVDLKALCRVVFPTTKRLDTPESFCLEYGIGFQDEMKNGGPLAAMESLLTVCVDQLNSLADPVRAVLRKILSRTNIPEPWFDTLLPRPDEENLDAYLSLLGRHLEGCPLPIKHSTGKAQETELTVVDFLDSDGYLPRLTAQFRLRPGQLYFAKKVEEATRIGRPYLLEAGTGTGKTLAYLFPLLLSKKRSYVATHTRTLQDQAWNKDVPLVLEALSLAGVKRSVAILKGKNNYFCPQTFAHWLEELDEGVSSDDAFLIAAIARWALITETGWLSELENSVHPSFLRNFGRDQAPPSLDSNWVISDPHTRAREAAASADLVLVNHSFVFSTAQFQTAEDSDIEILLIDEAHAIEDVVTEALTLDFTPWQLRDELASLLKRDRSKAIQGLLRAIISHPDADKKPVLRSFSDALFGLEEVFSDWCNDCALQLEGLASRQDGDIETPILFDLNEILVEELRIRSELLLTSLESTIGSLEELVSELPRMRGFPVRLLYSLGSLLEHLQTNHQALESLLSDELDRVHWGESNLAQVADSHQLSFLPSNGDWIAVFHSTPLNVADWLRGTLPALYRNRIYVSATLTVGSSFANVIERFGLENDDPLTDVFESPFDLSRQALLAVPTDMPYPQASLDSLYVEELSAFIAGLAQLADGCILVLFTSRRTMEEVALRLQGYLNGTDILVLSNAWESNFPYRTISEWASKRRETGATGIEGILGRGRHSGQCAQNPGHNSVTV